MAVALETNGSVKRMSCLSWKYRIYKPISCGRKKVKVNTSLLLSKSKWLGNGPTKSDKQYNKANNCDNYNIPKSKLTLNWMHF